MSFAVIETGGKQYKVSASNILKVEKLNIQKGKKVEFKKGFGPILGDINLDEIIDTNPDDFVKKLLPVYKGIEKVRNNL